MSFFRRITSKLERFISSETVTGLYGFQHLKTPKGFQGFVDEAIVRSDKLINYIIAEMPASSEIIRSMDEIYDTVNSVCNSAYLCKCTHPNREFVEEANKAAVRINNYKYYLHKNQALYNVIVKTTEKKDGHLLSKEAQRAAHWFRFEFERGGINLSYDQQVKFNHLSHQIHHLSNQFHDNIIADPCRLDIFPASRVPKILHPFAKPIYRTSTMSTMSIESESSLLKEKGFQIESSAAESLLLCASDQEVRKMAHVQRNSVRLANIDVLNDLVAARHELAQIMGNKSYVEHMISHTSCSPEVVRSFLIELSDVVRSKAEKEFKEIWEFKKEKCGQMSGDLESWDENYFMCLMCSSTCNGYYETYFSLTQCIEGLKMLAESLFGITFRIIPLTPNESWHPEVIKISLYHPEEGDLGFLYLDLISRKGKIQGFYKFPIREGRRVSETEYQLPIVAIICNFSSKLIRHFEVVTLFHEFGHAFHSLLSQTDYQCFSGGRLTHDLLETSSTLFEYFAWDYRILKRFAKNHSSGEVIPEKLLMSVQSIKRMFDATYLQGKIFQGLVDQTLFGEQSSFPIDMMNVVADLKRQYTTSKLLDGIHWYTCFRHFIIYGAFYSSYLYGRCFASTIWEKICEEDPLSSTMGSSLRKFWQYGAAKDSCSLLIDLAGNDIVRKNSHGIIIPSVTSLSKELYLHK